MKKAIVRGVGGFLGAGMLIAGGYGLGGGFESEPKATDAVVADAGSVASNCMDTAVTDVVKKANVDLNDGSIGQTQVDALNGGLEKSARAQASQCFNKFVTDAVASVFEGTPVPPMEADLSIRVKG